MTHTRVYFGIYRVGHISIPLLWLLSHYLPLAIYALFADSILEKTLSTGFTVNSRKLKLCLSSTNMWEKERSSCMDQLTPCCLIRKWAKFSYFLYDSFRKLLSHSINTLKLLNFLCVRVRPSYRQWHGYELVFASTFVEHTFYRQIIRSVKENTIQSALLC